MPMLDGPSGPDTFDSYEVHAVVERAVPGERNECETLDDPLDYWHEVDEALGYLFTVYGHFRAGGVYAITDIAVDDERSWDEAHDLALRLAGSLADGRPVWDEGWSWADIENAAEAAAEQWERMKSPYMG